MSGKPFNAGLLGLDCAGEAQRIQAMLRERVLQPEQVERVFQDIEAKRRAALYLHAPPALVEEVGSKIGC